MYRFTVVLCLGLFACGGSGVSFRSRSSSIAVSADGKTLYVVNADSDSVSLLDAQSRTLTRELLLADSAPAPSADGSTFTPAVMPRNLSLSPDGRTLYVVGERSGLLYAVELASLTVRKSVVLGSEPFGLALAPDGKSIYVACSQDETVVRVDAASLAVTATVPVPGQPWSLAWSPDDKLLLVSHFLDGKVSTIDPSTMGAGADWAIPDLAARGDKRLAHGQPRGLYALAARPGAAEVWVAHAVLGTDTAQPDLDFESTAFPSLSVLHGDGAFEQTLTTDAQDVPGVDGSFTDVVSGPHALAFTGDGRYLLMVDSNSEDVLAVDTVRRVEAGLLRPLPGHFPEGIALSPDEKFAYVDERNTGDVAVLALARTATGLTLSVDGAAIPRLMSDPMPPTLRLGQHLFNSANSDEYPLTKNHWISCATCHMEGRSDAVTWKFAQGPRDTPSNAGGTLGTGFLFRTADRTKVQDYWHTINVEQGGNFDPTVPALAALLDAITAYVNGAIPLPIPPTTDATKVAAGQALFNSVGCSDCHSGPRYTDSGQDNPGLDLAGFIQLHDVGTCVTNGDYNDMAHMDVNGDPRAACMFDTPSLNGVASSPPYFHDGSAATIHDVVGRAGPHADATSSLSAGDLDSLLEFVRSL